MSAPQSNKPVLRLRAGDWLVHLVVPAWIGTGAIMKLFTGSPIELPEFVLRLPEWLWYLGYRQGDYSKAGWQVFLLVVSVELVLAILIALHKTWARGLAIVTLLGFMAILLGAMQEGKDSCGCLGTVSTPPWVMLAIDGVMLLGALLLPFANRKARGPVSGARWAVIMATCGLAIGGAWLMFKNDLVGRWGDPAKLVAFDLERARNKPWRDTMLFKLLPITPADFPETKQTWILYRDTCPTCHALFETSFANEVPGTRVVGVKVPVPGAAPYELPAHITRTSLPDSKPYVILTPLVVVIEGDRIVDVSRVHE